MQETVRTRTRARVEPDVSPFADTAVSAVAPTGTMAELPWRRDLGVLGAGMGLGMALAVWGAWALPMFLFVLPTMIGHGIVGVLAGTMVRDAISFAQPRWSAAKGLMFAGAAGGGTAALVETLGHRFMEGHALGLDTALWWALGWGLAAAVAVPIAAVRRSEGRWVMPQLVLLGMVMGAFFQWIV